MPFAPPHVAPYNQETDSPIVRLPRKRNLATNRPFIQDNPNYQPVESHDRENNEDTSDDESPKSKRRKQNERERDRRQDLTNSFNTLKETIEAEAIAPSGLKSKQSILTAARNLIVHLSTTVRALSEKNKKMTEEKKPNLSITSINKPYYYIANEINSHDANRKEDDELYKIIDQLPEIDPDKLEADLGYCSLSSDGSVNRSSSNYSDDTALSYIKNTQHTTTHDFKDHGIHITTPEETISGNDIQHINPDKIFEFNSKYK